MMWVGGGAAMTTGGTWSSGNSALSRMPGMDWDSRDWYAILLVLKIFEMRCCSLDFLNMQNFDI
jgi:hypothetical protein